MFSFRHDRNDLPCVRPFDETIDTGRLVAFQRSTNVDHYKISAIKYSAASIPWQIMAAEYGPALFEFKKSEHGLGLFIIRFLLYWQIDRQAGRQAGRQADRQNRQTYRQTDIFVNISKSSVDEDGKHNSTEFKTFWRRRLSIELQRCNAQVIIRKLSRANQSRDSSTHTYSNQFYRWESVVLWPLGSHSENS